MKPLLILKTGQTLSEIAARRGDFEQWILEGLGFEPEEITVSSVYRDETLPDPASLSGVVVTGSSALVTEREGWSERSAEWLSEVVHAGFPVLGICYGHQLLAHALGGRVARNPLGREIGTVTVRLSGNLNGDALFSGLPEELVVQVSHVESVVELPTGARRFGASEGDPNQVFSLGENAWGIQFHPEFDADIVRGYIEGRRNVIAEEGLDPDQLHAEAKDSPHGTRVLRRFGSIVRSWSRGTA